MTDEEVIATCRAFLAFVISPERQQENVQDKTRALMRHLDQLALMMHDIVVPEPDDAEAVVPDLDYNQIYSTVCENFRGYDYYAVADLAWKAETQENSLGDPYDDIAHIYGDLKDFVWLYENSSRYDTFFKLTFNYQIHWGQHLRSAQLYLHDFMFCR